MSKKQNNLALGISESEKVDEYLDSFEHPLIDLVKYLRHVILKVDQKIGEGIYWNAQHFISQVQCLPSMPKIISGTLLVLFLIDKIA